MKSDTTNQHTLTDTQKLRFKRNGFLAITDALNEGDIAEAREHLYDIIPEDPRDPSSWASRNGDHDEILHRGSESDTASRFTNVEPFERLYRQVYDYAEQLVGTDVLAAPDERPAEHCLHGGHLMTSRENGTPAVAHDGAIGPILQYPSDITDENENVYDYRERRHIDGSTGSYVIGNPDIEYLPFTIACAVYFDNVEPRGGGFTVWPGSHRKTEQYFQNHTYGDYMNDQDTLESLNPGPEFEITGGPGTLVLWHHNIIHGAAPNHSERIRMAGFQRIAAENIDEIRQSALSDLWKMYPAMQDITPVFHDNY